LSAAVDGGVSEERTALTTDASGLGWGRSPPAGIVDRQGPPGELNQRIQLATDLLGPDASAWESDRSYAESLPYEVSGMLRSRANTIEGGTTEVNKNVVGERVLGLPREPDLYADAAWREVPHS
jgi:hypothetical protein